jgi:hypothetical protein
MREVSRRRCLRATVASGVGAVSGCLRSPFAAPFTSPIASADGGVSTAVDGSPIQELAVDRIPEPVPFTGSVTVLRQPESLQVGVLRVTLRNEGTEPWTISITPPELPFPPDATGSLVVSDNRDWDDADGCLRRSDGLGHGVSDRERVEPGDNLQGRNYVMTHVSAGTCLPAGEYWFSNGYSAGPAAEDPSDRVGVEWGFTLVLE